MWVLKYDIYSCTNWNVIFNDLFDVVALKVYVGEVDVTNVIMR